MPELNFVLPHWVYWGGLILFPLCLLILNRYLPKKNTDSPIVSLPLAYFLLLTGGFIGLHRLYVKSRWALAFIALFVGILVINVQVRDARDTLSDVTNDIKLAEFKISRAEKAIKKGRRGAQEKLAKAQQRQTDAQAALSLAQKKTGQWNQLSTGIGALMVLLLLIDAWLLPGLVRKQLREEKYIPHEGFSCPNVEKEHDDSRELFLFNRAVSRLNATVGEFVAYWSILAVVVYYYEVIARYVFNSPTNWAHESMFLMFGMQYLLAGGYVLREGAHVRVDVIYMYLPNRIKAIVDIFSSIFFFIFTIALLITGWIFFHDSFEVGEVSFTEWGIQYWPIKFALPLGAALLLLQGVAQLLNDIAAFLHPDEVILDTEVRPEG